MARKDAIAKLKSVLVSRRDALRKALDGDFSALQALRDQASGDVVDFALDLSLIHISEPTRPY